MALKFNPFIGNMQEVYVPIPGVLYKITLDLTVTSFYEYRVRQLIISGADFRLEGGDLLITG